MAHNQEAISNMTLQVAADKDFIIAHASVLEDKANRVEQQAKSVTVDRAEINVMKKAVLAAKKTIKATATKITTEANRFLSEKNKAVVRLRDQAEATTVSASKVDAQMSAAQHLINDAVIVVDKLEKGIGQGNNVIRTIESLDTTEQDVIAVKKQSKIMVSPS